MKILLTFLAVLAVVTICYLIGRVIMPEDDAEVEDKLLQICMGFLILAFLGIIGILCYAGINALTP